MKLSSLMEVIYAGHLSYHVESPYEVRGGIMLVAPPASLKSSIIKETLTPFPDARVLSDINVTQLNRIRDDIAGGVYTTLAFPALEKLYERHPTSAMNIEGHLKAMVDEGFNHGAFEDQRMKVRRALCFVVGAITTSIYERNFSELAAGGFHRRFLWSFFEMDNSHVLMEAIHRWQTVSLKTKRLMFKPEGRTKYTVTDGESRELLGMIDRAAEGATPFILLKKILCALRWKYPSEDYGSKAIDIIRDFSESLRGYAKLSFDTGEGIAASVAMPTLESSENELAYPSLYKKPKYKKAANGNLIPIENSGAVKKERKGKTE